MSGHIKIDRGYRMRRMGPHLLVDYLRRWANPHLPRSFRWLAPSNRMDLTAFIGALVARDRKFQRTVEAAGLVEAVDDHPPEPPAHDAPLLRIRMGLDWLDDVYHGREVCILPTHAWIEIRTSRNGCCAQELLKWRRETCDPPQPLHHVVKDLIAGHVAGRGFQQVGDAAHHVYHGWAITWLSPQMQGHCRRLVPRCAGDVVCFTWHGPATDNYAQLRAVLDACNDGSVLMREAARRQGWLKGLQLWVPSEAPPWTTLSRCRLHTILYGRDHLLVPTQDLLRSRTVLAGQVPVSWAVRLVDSRLDDWQVSVSNTVIRDATEAFLR